MRCQACCTNLQSISLNWIHTKWHILFHKVLTKTINNDIQAPKWNHCGRLPTKCIHVSKEAFHGQKCQTETKINTAWSSLCGLEFLKEYVLGYVGSIRRCATRKATVGDINGIGSGSTCRQMIPSWKAWSSSWRRVYWGLHKSVNSVKFEQVNVVHLRHLKRQMSQEA